MMEFMNFHFVNMYDTLFDIDKSGDTQGREGGSIIDNYLNGKHNQKMMSVKSELSLTDQIN